MRPLVACVFLIACAGGSAPQASSFSHDDSIANVAEEYWEITLAYAPMAATVLGDTRFDDLLDDLSPSAQTAYHKALRGLLARASALQDDRLNRDLLIEAIENTLRVDEACHFAEWKVDHLEGVQAQLAEIASVQKGPALAKRWAQVPRFISQHIDNLKRGRSKGWVAAEVSIKRTIAQIDAMTPAMFGSDRGVTDYVMPALKRYRGFLTTLVPDARKTPGIAGLSFGPACYRAKIREHTGLAMDPVEIHRLGIAEVARIRREMGPVIVRIAKKKLSVRQVAALLEADPKQHVKSREALLAETRAIVARAQAVLPRAFAKLPRTPLVVEPLEAYRERESPAAFYSPASIDGRRPGRYLLNTFAPESRVAYDFEALAYHEAVPGHHLQVALAQELTGLPAFRRYGGQSAFVEGWALYAEKLAKELGLYATDASDFGRLSAESWRALRLVVDTGIHVYGWSREQAIETMLDSAASPRIEVENEVDRYITWPAQALAYKIGELEIWRLRREAERKPGFDLRAFHASILEHGPLPLGILARLQRRP